MVQGPYPLLKQLMPQTELRKILLEPANISFLPLKTPKVLIRLIA